MNINLDNIKQVRKKIGLTQTELARRAGVNQSTIAKMERKTVNPSYNTLMKVINVLSLCIEIMGIQVAKDKPISKKSKFNVEEMFRNLEIDRQLRMEQMRQK